MSAVRKIKTGATRLGIALLIVIGWGLMMALYLTIYNVMESQAVPVMLPLRDFSAEQWDNGYFQAKGSYRNESAIEQGDEMVPGVTQIECWKATNTCNISTADVFDHFLNLDTSSYNDVRWDNRQITFSDDTAICVDQSFVIDRVSQTFTIISRKKAIIPEYALKSPLRPCDNIKDENVTLADGLQVYQHKIDNYERANGLKFHALLVVFNIAYFAFLLWLWRRRQRPNPDHSLA